jgi:hypothetical protein
VAAIKIESIRDGGFVVYEASEYPMLQDKPVFAGAQQAVVDWVIGWIACAHSRDKAFQRHRGPEPEKFDESSTARITWCPEQKRWRTD